MTHPKIAPEGYLIAQPLPLRVFWITAWTLSVCIWTGCETTRFAKVEKVKIPMLAPEHVIQSELYYFTPVGMPVDEVLAFVRSRLFHSESRDIGSQQLTVALDRDLQTHYQDFKMIQVHMGVHGTTTKNLIMDSNWVFITWLFDEYDKLVEILVTRVRPADYEPA